MKPLDDVLERVFEKGHALLAYLSQYWYQGTNRRSVTGIVVVGILAALMYVFLIQPPDNFPVDELVTVREGATLQVAAVELKTAGVVRSGIALRALVRLMGTDRAIRAGDYLFSEPRDVFAVAKALSTGAFGLEPIRIRIHEGAMVKEMAVIFARQLKRFDQQKFLAQATAEEGYLFPDTYFFMPNATEGSIIQAMRQNFDSQVATMTPQIASSTHSLGDIVTMASIVEREARNSKDRRMIAGVLWNRLARGMALQVDVTFLYTIGKGTFDLTMADLVSDSPYNTYKNKGLPPTPIGSPSLDSLFAATVPTKNDFLFYLADKHGVTHFSKTYQEHLRKKRLYLGT